MLRCSGLLPTSQLMNLAEWVFFWYIFFFSVIPFLFFLVLFFERLFIFILLLGAFGFFSIFFFFCFWGFPFFPFACCSLSCRFHWWKNCGRAWYRKILTAWLLAHRLGTVYVFPVAWSLIGLAVIRFLVRSGSVAVVWLSLALLLWTTSDISTNELGGVGLFDMYE